jgi:hypothetical protein
MDLLKQICNVIIIGLRYYPVLLCVELKRKSKLIYFLTTLYVLFLFVMYLYMNIFCLLSASQAIKEANSEYKDKFKFDFMSTTSTQPSLIADFKMPLVKFSNGSNLANNKNKFSLSSSIDSNITENDLRPLFLNFMNYIKNDRLKVNHDDLVSTGEQTNTIKDSVIEKLNYNTSELDLVKNTLFLNNIMYEKFLFYAVLCLITLYMLVEFFMLVKSSLVKLVCQICCIKRENDDHGQTRSIKYTTSKYKHEINYTKNLFYPNKTRQISYVRYLFEKYVYRNDKDFRFSKQFINTQIIAFILLYYITCIIIRKSKLIVNLSSNLLIFMINFMFKADSSSETNSFLINSRAQLNSLIQSLFDHISSDIVFACCMTTGIYLLQLFLGIRNYKKNVLNSYKGIYRDIPSPKMFSNTKLTSSSLHYR